MAQIDYFYSAHSAYAYLGAARLYEICAQTGADLIHRPILLSPVVEASGSKPFDDRSQAHDDYFFGRELERWAEWRDVPMMRGRPTHHDNDYAVANCVIIAAQAAGQDVDAVSFAILRAHWCDDADLSNVDHLRGALKTVTDAADHLLELARDVAAQTAHAENTRAAQAQSFFGSPTYVVDGDVFYGQDRLEMVARAVTRPFRR